MKNIFKKVNVRQLSTGRQPQFLVCDVFVTTATLPSMLLGKKWYDI